MQLVSKIMQKIYKELLYKEVLRVTEGTCIDKGIIYRNKPNPACFVYSPNCPLGHYSHRTIVNMITYMLNMYSIKLKPIYEKDIILCDYDDMILRYDKFTSWLHSFNLYDKDGKISREKLLLFLGNPLKFIKITRSHIDNSEDDDIKSFFSILEKNVTKKLNEPVDIYLVLKAMAYEHMIVNDVINMIAVVYIDIISSFGSNK